MGGAAPIGGTESTERYCAGMEFRDYDTRLAAYCVIVSRQDGRDCVLLSMLSADRTRWGSMWTLPGGGVEYDEGFEEAAVREVKEETGFDAEIVGMLGARTFTPQRRGDGEPGGRPFKSAAVIFEAVVTGGTLGTLEVGGSTEYAAWVPIDDVAPGPQAAGRLPDHTSAGPDRTRDGVRVVSTVGYALDLWRRLQRTRSLPVT